MKVLLINNQHSRMGGAHSVYFNTGNILSQNGVEVIYFAMHSECEEVYTNSNDFCKEVRRKSILKYSINYFYNRDARKKLENLLKRERPDIAHIHLFYGCLSSSILKALKKYNIPVVHTVHDYCMLCVNSTLLNTDNKLICEKCIGMKYINAIKSKCVKGSFLKSLISSLELYFRKCFFPQTKFIDHLHFVSNFCRDKHFQLNPNLNAIPSSVIYNVTSTFNGGTFRRDYTEKYLLYFGRLSYEKGVKTLIEAVSKIPVVRLLIVGTGPEEQSLKAFANEKKANVEFCGFKKGEELNHLIANAWFVCVPSEWYENNPMTIIEAYSMGIPVIASSIGGITEIVNDGSTGYLFTPFSVTAICDTIDKCLSLSTDNYKQMQINARRLYDDKFSDLRYFEKLMEMYYKTIKKRDGKY